MAHLDRVRDRVRDRVTFALGNCLEVLSIIGGLLILAAWTVGYAARTAAWARKAVTRG